MDIQLYVGNLSKFTNQKDLSSLFSRAGQVVETNLIMDQESGESKGYAFVTMSAQREADIAENMFNGFVLIDHELKVHLVNPRAQRGIKDPVYVP